MDIFKLMGKIVLDGLDEAEKGLDGLSGKAETSESRLTGALKKIGGAVITYFATDKIIDFGKACVDLSATVAAEESAFEQIMGGYADSATEKMGEVADATGMVDSRLTPYMTSMTAKFKGLGYDIDEATTYAQDGLVLAADAAAFWDKSLDESMSHLNSFVNGSYEGGEAIGLFANDTQMAAYAVEKGLVSETKEWSKLEEKIKQATRLEYAQNMMKQSGAVGQAAKESGQYANQMANLSEKWRQVKADIGEPVLEKFVLPAVEKLSGFLDENINPALDFFTEKVIPVVEDVGDYLGDNFMPIVEDIAEDVFPVIETALENVVPLIENVGYFLKPILEFVEPIFEVACNGLAFIIDSLVDLPVTLGIIKDDTYLISEEYLQMSENADKMSESVQAIKDENKEIATQISNEYDGYRELAGELDTLIGKNGEIKEHCETRVKQIIEQLNPALGTSLEIVDGQLQGYKDINTELDNIITKKQVETLLESGAENYNQLISDRAESMKAKTKAETDIEELQKEYAERERNAELYTDYGIQVEGFDFSTNTEEMLALKADIESLSGTIEKETGNIQNFNSQISAYEGLLNASTENNIGAMKRYTEIYNEQMLTAGNATLGELQTQYTEFSDIYDQMVKDRENGDQSITDEMLKGAKRRENIALDEMQKQQKIAYNTARSSASSYNSGMTSKVGEISATSSYIGNVAQNGLEFDGSIPANNSMSKFHQAVSSWRDTIVGTVQGLMSTIEALGAGMNVEVAVADIVASAKHYTKIQEHAKGGIVTKEHIARVGEDGAEAIIPLEHNTEWIDRVAERMNGSVGNSEVVTLLNEIKTLLTNQKIYLDGKSLVGGIANEMDRKLGSMARFKRRGVT